MVKFNIISRTNGSLRGTISGENYQDAENKCSDRGFDMEDEYMLVSEDDKQSGTGPRFVEYTDDNPRY